MKNSSTFHNKNQSQAADSAISKWLKVRVASGVTECNN